MTTYRVEIDGETVWEDERDDDLGAKAFPAEYLTRPVAEEGQPFPSAHVLYLNDEIIGVQISQAEEDHYAGRVAQKDG